LSGCVVSPFTGGGVSAVGAGVRLDGASVLDGVSALEGVAAPGATSGAVAVPGKGALTAPDGGAIELPGAGVSEPSGVTVEPAVGEVAVEPAVFVGAGVVVTPNCGCCGGGCPLVGGCGTHAEPVAPIPPTVEPLLSGASVTPELIPPTVEVNPPGAGHGSGAPATPIGGSCAHALAEQASAAPTNQRRTAKTPNTRMCRLTTRA
jgi:hypothetical protein